MRRRRYSRLSAERLALRNLFWMLVAGLEHGFLWLRPTGPPVCAASKEHGLMKSETWQYREKLLKYSTWSPNGVPSPDFDLSASPFHCGPLEGRRFAVKCLFMHLTKLYQGKIVKFAENLRNIWRCTRARVCNTDNDQERLNAL
jgi:hypothetical protein